MWPLARLKEEQIHIVCSPEYIACYWFQQNKNNTARLKAYERYKGTIASSALLFNPTQACKSIQHFIDQYNLRYGYAYFVLLKPFVHEQFISHPKSNATHAELIPEYKRHNHYQSACMGHDDQSFLFYVCTISQPLLLQLKLLSYQLPLHVARISCPLTIQVILYRRLQAKAFRQAQLMQELDKERMIILPVFSLEFLHRCVQTEKPIQKNNIDMLYALGSFFAGQEK